MINVEEAMTQVEIPAITDQRRFQAVANVGLFLPD